MGPMIDTRFRSRLSLWITATLLLAVSCATPPSDVAPPDAGPVTIRAHLSKDPASLSLIGKTDRNAEILAAQITDSLVRYDERMKLRPWLAESWEFSDDRLALTFRLRPGVRWHDGRPVTAEDVVFTVERLRDPATENRVWAPEFRDLETIEALDPATVRARYSRATPDVLEGWRVPVIPRHLAGADEDLLTGDFSRHPVGCGAFRFVSYTPGQQIVLEANDDHWNGRPAIDRLVFKIYPDQRTAYQALLTGDLDILVVTSALWTEALESEAAERLEAFTYSSLSVWTVFWNQDGSNPFFTDPAVRQAMVLALDREPFIRSVVHGHARAGATSYHPDTPWASPDVEPWPYDPDEARRRLDEAGWRDRDGDGVRERNGTPFRFTLTMPAGSQRLANQIAAWLQQSWAEVGVAAEIETLEWQALRERRNAGRFQALSFSLSFSPHPDHLELYHSTARETGYNFYGLEDAEVDALLEEGRVTFDGEKRREVYHRLQRRLHELEPITCLFYFSSPVLHDRRLRGVTPSPLGFWQTTQGPRVWRWSDEPAGD